MFVRLRVRNVSWMRLVGSRRHVADLGLVEQDHRTQRGRNGGCRVSPAIRCRDPALPFVLLLAQTAKGFDCRDTSLFGRCVIIPPRAILH